MGGGSEGSRALQEAGATPLLLAVRHDHTAVVDALLVAGVDTEACDEVSGERTSRDADREGLWGKPAQIVLPSWFSNAFGSRTF